MPLADSLSRIERRFAWSFAGFLIGVISLVVAISVFYITRREARTDLKVVVEDEVNLVEIRETLPLLKILYDDENILDAGKEIKLLRLSVRNDGQTLLQGNYDVNQPFDLTFANSIVLAAKLVESNSEYLEQHLFKSPESSVMPGTNTQKNGSIALSKVIFERNKYARFKVFLLQDKGITTTGISVQGKVAGMDAIPVLHEQVGAETSGEPSRRPAGEIVAWIIGGYFGFLFFLVGVIAVIEGIQSRQRNSVTKRFLKDHDDLTDVQRRFVESYRSGWDRHSCFHRYIAEELPVRPSSHLTRNCSREMVLM
ncbi:MAG: hypothetical protein NTU74_00415 [Deltaproteobacteria bacterium]|nr:hypothetical protein [Deltaproteobacteria bacterium]